MTFLHKHNCTLLKISWVGGYVEVKEGNECEICETYFWANIAKNNQDEEGLRHFLDEQVVELRKLYTTLGIINQNHEEKEEGYQES